MQTLKDDMLFIQDVTEGFKEQSIKDKQTLEKAYKLAIKVHKNQTRDEGTPYITHINAILEILINELNITNSRVLTVATLHDVVEDSSYTIDDMAEQFDSGIAEQVDLLTKRKNMSTDDYIMRMTAYKFSALVITIKLADRLHNVRSLKYIANTKQDKVIKYINETNQYYIPLAKSFPNKVYDLLDYELTSIKELIHENE